MGNDQGPALLAGCECPVCACLCVDVGRQVRRTGRHDEADGSNGGSVAVSTLIYYSEGRLKKMLDNSDIIINIKPEFAPRPTRRKARAGLFFYGG